MNQFIMGIHQLLHILKGEEDTLLLLVEEQGVEEDILSLLVEELEVEVKVEIAHW